MKLKNFNDLGICGDCKEQLATHAKGSYVFSYEVNGKIINTVGMTEVNMCCDCFRIFVEVTK